MSSPRIYKELLPDFINWVEKLGYTYRDLDFYLIDKYGRDLVRYPLNHQDDYVYGVLKGKLLVGAYNQEQGEPQPIKYVLMQSFTDPSITYIIGVGKFLTCTCPYSQFNKPICKHREAVLTIA